jgi:hypothetical protein
MANKEPVPGGTAARGVRDGGVEAAQPPGGAVNHQHQHPPDTPLDDEPPNWRGFTGTHILEVGWHGVDQLCAQHGYMLDWRVDHDTDPSSGGRARACLYLRE